MRCPKVLACLVVFTTILLQIAPAEAQRQAAQERARGQLGQNAALRYWQAFAHMPALDEGQQKLLASSASAGAVDPTAAKLAEEGRNALLYLNRGAAIRECDWGLHPEDGPYLLLPHLSRGRNLARLAAVRARVEFAAGNGAAGVDSAADAIVLGRHLASDLTAIISYLVQIGVERIAIEALAADLGGLDAAAMDRLDRRLAALPQGGSLEACMRVERDTFIDWALGNLRRMNDQDPWKQKVLQPLSGSPDAAAEVDALVAASGGTREAVIKQLEGLRGYYDQLGPILSLPRAQFQPRLAELQKRVEPNPLAKAVLPAMQKVYDRDAAGRTRMTLLKAAAAVARGGPERAMEFKDAEGNAIEYQATADGFELRSKVMDDGQVVVLKVGGRK